MAWVKGRPIFICVVLALICAVLGAVLGLWGILWEVAFGSDELSPYTAKYAWLENQMSHAMMGFFLMGFFWALFVRNPMPAGPPLIGMESAEDGHPRPPQRTWFLALPFLFVLVKDFVLDNVKDASATWGSPVQPYWPSVLFDAITDDVFWCLGFSLVLFGIGFFSAGSGLRWWRWLIASGVLLLFGLLFGSYWVPQKDSFDRSGLPLNYTRLAYLAKELDFPDDARAKQHRALREIQNHALAGQPAHVIVLGGTPQKRNALAVSLGCEYVFRLGSSSPRGWTGPTTVVYTTAARLLEDPRPVEALDAGQLRCLVIADLDTSLVPPPDVLIEAARKRNRPDIISGGVRNQLDLNNFFKSGPNQGALYTRDTPLDGDDLQDLGTRYRTGKMRQEFDELRLAALNRTDPYRKLATRAREAQVATIWTFAETPSWLGEMCKPDVEARHRQADRDAWVFTLADLLGVPEDTLYLIELSKP